MKKNTISRKRNSASTKSLRILKECLSELRALQNEAGTILHALLINPYTRLARDLCARFHVLQAYFSIRYHEARTLAASAFGYPETSRTLR